MIESVRVWVNTLRMRRISRSGLDDECCGAWCGRQHGARTPFEIKRKHIQAKANAAELLNRQ
jgi:hypothetical protein